MSAGCKKGVKNEFISAMLGAGTANISDIQ